jgi:hypothetical protein
VKGKSHEKAGYHWGNAYQQHDALRGPFLPACVARGGRFRGAGHGGSPGRAAGDARQRRGCGAPKYAARGPALRLRCYLLGRAAEDRPPMPLARRAALGMEQQETPGSKVLARRRCITDIDRDHLATCSE